MRVFFSVGEPSGDLHGANLVQRLQAQGVKCMGYGGPKMAAVGCDLLQDLTQYAVMFLAALKFIPKLWSFYKDADRLFATGQIDAVVLIDFPGFNWWIAKAAKRHGVPVFYYGVPQMWAWMPWRVQKLKRLVDHSLCKLPFEVPWFEQRGCRAHYVGHPYFDELSQRQLDRDFLREYHVAQRPLITLLPGSRNQEVKNNLEWLIESALRIRAAVPTAAIAVACFNYHHAEEVKRFLEGHDLAIDVFVKRTPELIELSTVCLACSGSVSLELMYHHKPSVIIYRVNRIQAAFKWLALTCRFITLVNLLAVEDISRAAGKGYDPTVPNSTVPMPEFPWYRNPSQPIAKLVIGWLNDPAELERRREQLAELSQRFGQAGATDRAADYILRHLFAGDARETQNLSLASHPCLAIGNDDLGAPSEEGRLLEADSAAAFAAAAQVQASRERNVEIALPFAADSQPEHGTGDWEKRQRAA